MMERGGGAKVELNPKPTKIKTLGQFGTLDVYLKKHCALKYSVFFFSNTGITHVFRRMITCNK